MWSVVNANSLIYFRFPRFLNFKRNQPQNTTAEYFIKVLPYTGMYLVCPSDAAMNTWRTRYLYMLNLYENLWHVDKADYDNCEVNKDGKLLLLCNDPIKPKKIHFKFHPIFSTVEPRFEPGKHYYFISKLIFWSQFLYVYFIIRPANFIQRTLVKGGRICNIVRQRINFKVSQRKNFPFEKKYSKLYFLRNFFLKIWSFSSCKETNTSQSK